MDPSETFEKKLIIPSQYNDLEGLGGSCRTDENKTNPELETNPKLIEMETDPKLIDIQTEPNNI